MATFCQISNLSLITVSGTDAVAFLHQQLTNSVTDLDTTTVRLGGICSPQGRLLVTMHYWRDIDNVYLLVSADLSELLIKQLTKFVLRAKVKITCANERYAFIGLMIQEKNLNHVLLQHDFPALDVYQQTNFDSGQIVRLADANGWSRLLWLMPIALFEGIESKQLNDMKYVSIEDWNILEIHTGIPRITLATQNEFVPQMINFEIVQGINFKKGCYPGQEVVARMQYRGKVKRRLQIASVLCSTTPGALLFHTDDPKQPCGTVVNVALNAHGGMDILVELVLQAMDTGSIHLGNYQGPVLRFLPLPYHVPGIEDTAHLLS